MSLHRIAIVGRPNVGKSSLLNRLARRRVSIVDATPGVTRDRVTIELELDPPIETPRGTPSIRVALNRHRWVWRVYRRRQALRRRRRRPVGADRRHRGPDRSRGRGSWRDPVRHRRPEWPDEPGRVDRPAAPPARRRRPRDDGREQGGRRQLGRRRTRGERPWLRDTAASRRPQRVSYPRLPGCFVRARGRSSARGSPAGVRRRRRDEDRDRRQAERRQVDA